MIEKIPEELKETAAEAYMAEGENEELGQKDVEEVAGQLLREVIRERKKELMAEMNKAKQEKDEEKEETAFTEMNELNKKESKIIAFLG
jgi:flagellar biosynthesis/type III secretory pathway chaperone